MDCVKSAQPRDEGLIDAEHGQAYRSTAAAPAKTSMSVAQVALMTLLALLSISGFIMAAWSVSELRATRNELRDAKVDLSSAVLFGSYSQASRYGNAISVFSGSGYWSAGPDMLFERSDHSVVSNGTHAFVIGGLTADGNTTMVLKSVVAYDVYAQTSVQMEDMPEPRQRFGAAIVGKFIYVFGGLNQVDEQGVQPQASMMVYDIAANKWSMSPASMAAGRVDLCADAIDGKIYAAGGYDKDFTNSGVIEMYDPQAGQWSMLPANMSVARGDCVAVAAAGQLYIMGGTEQITPPGVDCVNDWQECYLFSMVTEAYNPKTGAVTRKRDMLHGRGDFAATLTSSGEILVAGGETQDRAHGIWRQLAHVWTATYSVEEDVWSAKGPLPEGRFRWSMARVGEQMVGFGGHPTCSDCPRVGLNSTLIFADAILPRAYMVTSQA